MLHRYIIDLRTYSDEDSEKLYETLCQTSYICNIVANRPKMYEVFWDDKDPIESILHIPPDFIIRTH